MATEAVMAQPVRGNGLQVPTSPMQQVPPGQEGQMQHDGPPQSGSPPRGPPPEGGPPGMGYPSQGGYGGGAPYPPYPQGPYGGPYGPPGGGYRGPPPSQPYGYGPPMHHPYHYPGYGPPGYGYGSGGGYPSQQAQGRGADGKKSGRSDERESKKGSKKSPGREKKGSSPQRARSSAATSPDKPSMVSSSTAKIANELEAARLRAAQAGDAGQMEVDPMRTDFHFFVKDTREKLQQEAEEEVRRSADNVDNFLIFSNLNSRLMKAWEAANQDVRDEYTLKEEEDRRRFMSDEEIASRHCATLTARAKSPRASEKNDKGEKVIKEEGQTTSEDGSAGTSAVNLTKEGKAKEEKAPEGVLTEGGTEEESKKRSSPTGEQNGSHPEESPTKKSKLSFDQDDDKQKGEQAEEKEETDT